MSKLTAAVAALLLASSAMSQACFDPAYGTSLGSANDTVHPAQSIGHAFPFDGATYTDIHISDHGVCWLSNGGLPAPAAPGGVTYNVLLSDFVLFGPCIAPFWADANCGYAPVTLGEVFINNTDPTKCVVTWSGMWTYNNIGPQYDVQMTLSDSGDITFLYNADVNNYGSTFAPNAIVGVTPGSNAFLPAATDLSAGGASANPSIFEEFLTASSFDMMSDGIRLIPTTPGWVVVPLGGPIGCALSETFGQGCIDVAANTYENMATGTFDLPGATITLLRGPSGYTVLDSLPGTFIAPSATAATIALGDDIEETVTLSSPMPIVGGTTSNLTVSSNGNITLSATGNGAAFTPDATAFLASAMPMVSAMWHDFSPNLTGSGVITFEEVNGVAVISWNGVFSFGTTTPETFQAQFTLATGDITIVYDPVHNNVGNGYLVGYTAGNGPLSVDGATDLSATLPTSISVGDTETIPVALDSNAPRVGTNWNLTTTNIDPISPIAITFFGDAQGPGVPLSLIGLNAPGCSVWINTILGDIQGLNVGGSCTISLPLPNNTALVGAVLTGQSVCLTLANAANLLTSNGVQGTIGQ